MAWGIDRAIRQRNIEESTLRTIFDSSESIITAGRSVRTETPPPPHVQQPHRALTPTSEQPTVMDIDSSQAPVEPPLPAPTTTSDAQEEDLDDNAQDQDDDKNDPEADEVQKAMPSKSQRVLTRDERKHLYPLLEVAWRFLTELDEFAIFAKPVRQSWLFHSSATTANVEHIRIVIGCLLVTELQVTEDIAPGYFSIISQPMDLSTIQSKLFKYRSVTDFDKDVQLMFENAQAYNPADNQVHKVRYECSFTYSGTSA